MKAFGVKSEVARFGGKGFGREWEKEEEEEDEEEVGGGGEQPAVVFLCILTGGELGKTNKH